jgi:acetoin utilization protein AcuB
MNSADRVREWMTRNPCTVTPETLLTDAYAVMMDRRIRRLPVLENQRLVGIVSMGDLRAKGVDTESAEAAKMRVDAVSTANPLTVTPDDTLVDAARIMIDRKIGGLPVVEDGALVGIISETDLVRALITTVPTPIPAEG